MPKRFRREAASLTAAIAQIEAEFGPDARIVSVEAVTTRGLRGFFARRFFDIEFEVPEPPEVVPPAVVNRDVQSGLVNAGTALAGIDALLDAADGGDALRAAMLAAPSSAKHPHDFAGPGTLRPEFDAVLAELTETTGGGRERSAVPVPRSDIGSLVMVLGCGEDAWEQARTIAAHSGAIMAQCGTHDRQAIPRADDRRHAYAVRAEAVTAGTSAVVAAGLPLSIPVSSERLQALASVAADQIWLVVDAGRKPPDLARWAAAIVAALPVDALAVTGLASTSTPHTVDELLVPIGWLDGRPAARSSLG